MKKSRKLKTKYKFTASVLLLLVLLAQCTSDKSSNQQLSLDEEKAYLEKGKAIAASSFAALSGKLTAAMENGGVANAVQYCNLAATPLIDSLSKANNATIRRTSLKPRNPANAPTEWETALLNDYQQQALEGGKLQPQVKQLEGGKVAFVAPIVLQPLCTKCHGAVGSEVAESDYAIIQNLYPQDKATDYKPGELRGMWSITFER